jgi:transketolase
LLGNNDLDGIRNAVREAQRVTDKPTLIKVRTTIGFGSAKQGTEKVHGSPLGDDDVAAAKKKFGLDPTKKFFVPEEVRQLYNKFKPKGEQLEKAWNELLVSYSKEHPELASELKRRISGALLDGWENVLPKSKAGDAEAATRKLSGICLNKLADLLPEIVGGSADLNPSTLTYLTSSKDFQKNSYEGRNIRFGVREHGMAAICNGLSAYGGVIPFCATFLNFIGYAFGAVTLSALSQLQVCLFTRIGLFLIVDSRLSTFSHMTRSVWVRTDRRISPQRSSCSAAELPVSTSTAHVTATRPLPPTLAPSPTATTHQSSPSLARISRPFPALRLKAL